MVLATHILVGGALGRLIDQPVVAFGAGFLSHFLLDAIPHWDYALRSVQEDRRDKLATTISFGHDFARDLIKIGSDFAVGVILLLICTRIFSWPINSALIWGAIGGVLPDFLQPIYFRWRWAVLWSLQKFHTWIHADWRLDNQPVIGIISQALLVGLVVYLSRLIF